MSEFRLEGNARLKDESYEDYRKRLKKEQEAVRLLSLGRVFYYDPKRKPYRNPDRLVKKAMHIARRDFKRKYGVKLDKEL